MQIKSGIFLTYDKRMKQVFINLRPERLSFDGKNFIIRRIKRFIFSETEFKKRR